MSSHDGTVTVTNDGATILKAVHIDNPAAKVLVDIAKTQVLYAQDPHTTLIAH